MLPADQTDPPAWMTDHRTVKVMRALGAYEAVPQALFVGGCVRNLLAGWPVSDIDIATRYQPLEVIERLKSAGIRYVPTGLEHGTITAIVEDSVFEVTTLRKDIETDGRHAVIAFTENWSEDSARRDFTMNTLLASPDGHIFDPTGRGLSDLKARNVIFVGNPLERIREDYLRILRFFRFHACYGQGAADAAALDACRAEAPNLTRISKERITQEIFKTVQSPRAAETLSLMQVCGVMPSLYKSYNQEKLQKLTELQQRYDAPHLGARLHAVAGKETWQSELVLSNACRRELEIFQDHANGLRSVNKKYMRRLVYAVGNVLALQIYFLRLCSKNEWPDLEMLDIARYWQAPEFPVRGEDLIATGIKPGPDLGKTLKKLEDKWIAKDFPENFAYKK